MRNIFLGRHWVRASLPQIWKLDAGKIALIGACKLVNALQGGGCGCHRRSAGATSEPLPSKPKAPSAVL